MRLILPLFIALMSCASAPSPASDGKIFRRDMPIEVDEVKYVGGVYVLDHAPSYKLTAFPFRKAMVFKASTCHREWVWHDAGKKIEFEYTPQKGLEDKGYCPLELGAFDTKGQHSWAFIDFKNPGETLPGFLGCNGRKADVYKGVSVCQSRAGLVQAIAFDDYTEVFNAQHCPQPETKDNFLWEIVTGYDRCVYLFRSDRNEMHRLTIIGYDNIIIRE